MYNAICNDISILRYIMAALMISYMARHAGKVRKAAPWFTLKPIQVRLLLQPAN